MRSMRTNEILKTEITLPTLSFFRILKLLFYFSTDGMYSYGIIFSKDFFGGFFRQIFSRPGWPSQHFSHTRPSPIDDYEHK